MVSYKRLIDRLMSAGLTVNALKRKEIITDSAYRSILNNKSVQLKIILDICQYTKIPIEELIDDGLNSREDESY